ncbi:MAG: helix-hairpin-helix domain-containing protein [Myxococcaceae bacterium]|nr:helix-hairpin-helix domain-containing protein [Myxococcaceae bacterium]
MRRAGVAALLLGLLAVGAVVALRWPSAEPALGLGCDPKDVHLDEAGVARCGPGKPLSAAQTLTAGGRLDLNRATEEELALVPGVGPKLAKAIADERRRRGGFKSWDEVDQVPGVGDHKLDALKATAEIR